MIFRKKCENNKVYSPKFQISNKILNDLIKIEVDLNIIKNVEIAPEWQSKLRRETAVRRIVSTLRQDNIEVKADLVDRVLADDPGRDEPVTELAISLGVVVKERELQAVINWLNSQKFVEQVVYLSTKFKQGELGEKELIQLNKLVGERMLVMDELGSFRLESFVENSLLRHPKPHEIPYQLEDILSWNRAQTPDRIHPVLRSAILLYELLRIRPFAHNNLQTIVLFCLMALGVSGLDFSYCAIEEELFRNKLKLFEVMALVDDTGNGIEEVISVVVEMMSVSCEKAKLRILNIVGESFKYKTESGRTVALTERQVALMEELTVKTQLTIKELRSVLPLVSDDTILRDLKDLVIKKMIRKKGKTKGAVYVMGKVKSFR